MFGIEKRHCQKCNFFFMYDIMRGKRALCWDFKTRNKQLENRVEID